MPWKNKKNQKAGTRKKQEKLKIKECSNKTEIKAVKKY